MEKNAFSTSDRVQWSLLLIKQIRSPSQAWSGRKAWLWGRGTESRLRVLPLVSYVRASDQPLLLGEAWFLLLQMGSLCGLWWEGIQTANPTLGAGHTDATVEPAGRLRANT